MDFLRQKSVFFLRKKYFDVPHAIGVLGRTFVEPITLGLSQRDHLLGAVAQWQLRLCLGHERSEDSHMVTFFWGTSGARLPIW